MNPLQMYGQQFAEQFLSGKTIDSVKSGITKMASDNKWNAHEIERVVESANRNILVSMSKNASKKTVDPHFTFPTIKTAEIIGMLSGGSPAMPIARAPTVMPTPVSVQSLPIASQFPSLAGAVSPDQFIDEEAPSKDIALMVLRLLKDRIALKKSKYCQMELRLNDAIEKFEKMASQEILAGAPPEILGIMGAKDIVENLVKRMRDANIKVASLKVDEVDVVESHPLYDLAEQIESSRKDLVEFKSEIDKDALLITSKAESIKKRWK